MLWQKKEFQRILRKLAEVNMFQTFKMPYFSHIPLPHIEDIQVWF